MSVTITILFIKCEVTRCLKQYHNRSQLSSFTVAKTRATFSQHMDQSRFSPVIRTRPVFNRRSPHIPIHILSLLYIHVYINFMHLSTYYGFLGRVRVAIQPQNEGLTFIRSESSHWKSVAGMTTKRALKLAYTSYRALTASNQNPIIILHGLLGNKMNWRSIAKSLTSQEFGMVYCVDARNHGASPWSDDVSYESMAEDILNFIHNLNATNVSVIGHSMGGKIGMTAALMEPTMVDKLVVVDIAPNESRNRADSDRFLSLMSSVNLDKKMTEAGNLHNLRALLMKEWEIAVPSTYLRSFILTNLTESDGQVSWKINVEALRRGLGELFSYPYSLETELAFDGPSLFVSGELSSFLQPEEMPHVLHFFPRAERAEIAGAGHWVHVDAPDALLDAISKFLRDA